MGEEGRNEEKKPELEVERLEVSGGVVLLGSDDVSNGGAIGGERGEEGPPLFPDMKVLA